MPRSPRAIQPWPTPSSIAWSTTHTGSHSAAVLCVDANHRLQTNQPPDNATTIQPGGDEPNRNNQTLTPLSARLDTTPFDIEMTVRLQPKRAFGINRNGRPTSPKYALMVADAQEQRVVYVGAATGKAGLRGRLGEHYAAAKHGEYALSPTAIAVKAGLARDALHALVLEYATQNVLKP